MKSICVLVILLFIGRTYSFAQNISNEGLEFYAVFPTHVPGALDGNAVTPAKYNILITSRYNSSGVITVGPGTFTTTFSVAANSVITIDIPRSAAYIAGFERDVILKKAIHIKVDDGKPAVVVYGHMYGEARSAASLILPVNALGQKYFSMNYDQFSGGSPADTELRLSLVTIVAADDNTRIFIRPRKSNASTGQVIQVDLPKKGDVYEYGDTQDLTGTVVEADPVTSSCKRFAVFTGSSTTSIGGCTTSSDPLYQQAYPVESWGSTYGFVPFSDKSANGTAARTRGSIYRVVAKEDGTDVRFNNVPVATLNAGQFFESNGPLNTPGLITSTKPVAVAQYSLTQECAGPGFSDPDMVLLNPVEYNISNITVYSSPLQNIAEQYINILIKTTGAASFKINGKAPPGSFTALGNTGYSYLKLNLNQFRVNNFSLSAIEGFNAIAYGFGRVESYAYSAGTSLASRQSLTAVRISNPSEELSNACTREDFRFKLILPDIATKLSYDFGDGDEVYVDENPVATPVTLNGKTVFQYFHPKPKLFSTPGQRNIKVIATYPSATECYTSEQEINFTFEVYDPPEPKFSAGSIACINTAIAFKDESISNGRDINKWTWDFGDGGTSALQNPEHTYLASGDYTVRLFVENGTNCTMAPFEQVIRIRVAPTAAFTADGATCTSNTITFRDASQSSAGQLTRWLWDFGDGTNEVRTNNAAFTHTYAKVGNYTPILKVEDSFGCQSNPATQPVSVFSPSLEAGPDRTILIGGEVKLEIESDGNNLRYQWSPATGLDRDDIKRPIASPASDITYTVTITSEEGCTVTDQVTVKVIPDFVVPNAFTPNGDGVNDTWNIHYLDTYPDVVVTVFNRYGEKVLVSLGYTSPWDGRFNGNDVPVGTYYYTIQARNRKPHAGYVTVIR